MERTDKIEKAEKVDKRKEQLEEVRRDLKKSLKLFSN